MPLVSDLGGHILLLIERSQPARGHLLIGLVGQRHAVLGVFLVRVDLVLQRADRAIQVSELLVHDPEILFHLPDVILQYADGIQLDEQSGQKPHDALEDELSQRQDAFVRDDEDQQKNRPDQNREVQRVRRRRDQERKNLHESIRYRDAAEDQHDFPGGPFRPLPEILQALHYRGTRIGCHGVSLSQNRFKFLALLLNLGAPPFQRCREIVLGLLQLGPRYFRLRLHRLHLLLQFGNLFLFLLNGLVDIADLANLGIHFRSRHVVGLFVEGGRRGIQNIQQSIKALQNRVFRQAALRLRCSQGSLVPQCFIRDDGRKWGRKSFDFGQLRNRGKVRLLGQASVELVVARPHWHIGSGGRVEGPRRYRAGRGLTRLRRRLRCLFKDGLLDQIHERHKSRPYFL